MSLWPPCFPAINTSMAAVTHPPSIVSFHVSYSPLPKLPVFVCDPHTLFLCFETELDAQRNANVITICI